MLLAKCSFMIKHMHKQNQVGSASVVVAVVSSVLLVGVGAFAVWAFLGRQDYKNNAQQKINSAVSTAQAAQSKADQQKFDEQAKNPNKTYQGSPTYGSISFNYPKTWSAYVDETNPSQPLNGYFYPTQVPGVQSSTAFALRAQLLTQSYASALQQFSSQIKQGAIKAAAYIPPKMAGKANVQPGTRLDGAINRDPTGAVQQGSMVVIQVRDKVLEISTQSNNFLPDFNNTVLASLTFVP